MWEIYLRNSTYIREIKNFVFIYKHSYQNANKSQHKSDMESALFKDVSSCCLGEVHRFFGGK